MSEFLFSVMCVLTPIFGVAFAASFVWLVVRLVSRRERWAKRLGVALVAMMMGYLLSFGPIARIESRGVWSRSQETLFEAAYFPFCIGANFGPQWMRSWIKWYADLWGAK